MYIIYSKIPNCSFYTLESRTEWIPQRNEFLRNPMKYPYNMYLYFILLCVVLPTNSDRIAHSVSCTACNIVGNYETILRLQDLHVKSEKTADNTSTRLWHRDIIEGGHQTNQSKKERPENNLMNIQLRPKCGHTCETKKWPRNQTLHHLKSRIWRWVADWLLMQ